MLDSTSPSFARSLNRSKVLDNLDRPTAMDAEEEDRLIDRVQDDRPRPSPQDGSELTLRAILVGLGVRLCFTEQRMRC